LTQSNPSEPINIKNAKNDNLVSHKERKYSRDLNNLDEINTFRSIKNGLETHTKVEGATRFADLATKSITKIDSNKIVKSPTN